MEKSSWKRKDLKSNARKSLKRNYLFAVIVCIITAVLIDAHPFIDTQSYYVDTEEQTLHAPFIERFDNTKTVNDVIDQIFSDNNQGAVMGFLDGKASDYSRGALSSVVNNANQSGSFVFGLLNAINQSFFQDQVRVGIILFAGIFLLLLYIIFIDPIFIVGEKRFFMESRTFHGTRVSRLFFLIKVKRLKNSIIVLLMRRIFLILWSLTIVGGVIKFYSYRMVPYILAENPDIYWKDAITLSKEMMFGNKFRTFILDVTFVLWHGLALLTFGILNVVYVNPYKTATSVELYMKLRQDAIDDKVPYHNKFVDLYLTAKTDAETYPSDKFHIEEKESIFFDYSINKPYSAVNLIILFFVFSIIGWCWEIVLNLLNNGEFINRGVLTGPWLPIYGSGGVLLLLILKKWRDNPLITFIFAVLLCGVVEYFTGWYLETFMQAKWWDYTGYLFNIHGRVCLEGLLFFGLGGMMFIYFLAPLADHLLNRVPKKYRIGICVVLCSFFVVDLGTSFTDPNSGDGISTSL